MAGSDVAKGGEILKSAAMDNKPATQTRAEQWQRAVFEGLTWASGSKEPAMFP
jgi:hypothetical protein